MVIILPEVQDFVEKLEKSSMNKVIRLIQLLERFGHNLGMPHAKAISQNLFVVLRFFKKIATNSPKYTECDTC